MSESRNMIGLKFLSNKVDKCANCHINAECIYGRCRCMEGYLGTGYVCEKGK